MSISGVGSSGLSQPNGLSVRDGVRQSGRATGQAASPAAPTAAPSTGQGLSVAAPPGTDPALWSILSSAERSHFAKLGAMGPLTYGRLSSGSTTPQMPSIRGGRLDVKV